VTSPRSVTRQRRPTPEAGRKVGVDHRQRRREPWSDEIRCGVGGDDSSGADVDEVLEGGGDLLVWGFDVVPERLARRRGAVLNQVEIDEPRALVGHVHVSEP